MTRNRVFLIIQSVLIILLAYLLSSAAIRIFIEGEAIQQSQDIFYKIYSREIVSSRFAPIAPLFFMALGLTIAGWILGAKNENARKPVSDPEIQRNLTCARVQMPSPEMSKERRRQKMLFWGGWIVFILCMLPVLLYCLNGAHFSHPYEGTDEDFLALMRVFIPWVCVGFGVLCVCSALRGRSEQREAEAARDQLQKEKTEGLMAEAREIPCKAVEQTSSKGIRVARMVVIVLAVVLIIAGIANGGSHDVLLKATTICMECVGLG